MKLDAPKLSDVPVEIDSAAKVFATGLPVYKNLVDSLSLKSVKRLSKALVEYPLHNEKQALLQSAEAQVFELAMELLEAKAVMIEYSVKEQHKRQLENNKDKEVADAAIAATAE